MQGRYIWRLCWPRLLCATANSLEEALSVLKVDSSRAQKHPLKRLKGAFQEYQVAYRGYVQFRMLSMVTLPLFCACAGKKSTNLEGRESNAEAVSDQGDAVEGVAEGA